MIYKFTFVLYLVFYLTNNLKCQEVSYLSRTTSFPSFKTTYLLNGDEIEKNAYDHLLGGSDYKRRIENKTNFNKVLSIGGLLLVTGAVIDDAKNHHGMQRANGILFGVGFTSYCIGNYGAFKANKLLVKQRDEHNRKYFGTGDKYVSLDLNLLKPKFTINGVPISDQKMKLLVSSESKDIYFEDFIRLRKKYRTVLYSTLIGTTAMFAAQYSPKFENSDVLAYSSIALSSVGIYYSLKLNVKLENSRTRFMDRINLSQLY